MNPCLLRSPGCCRPHPRRAAGYRRPRTDRLGRPRLRTASRPTTRHLTSSRR